MDSEFNKRNNEVLKMRENGQTYQYIGDTLGISRQRVHQLIKGYYKGKNKVFFKPKTAT